MDQEQLRHFTDVYRQMRDEQLAALLGEQSTLTDEARQALLAVVAERPDASGIRRRAMDEARIETEAQARKEVEKEARRQAELSRDRPRPGFWLGFLTVCLCLMALRGVAAYAMVRISETYSPQVLELHTWPIYKAILLAASIGGLIAAGIAVHAIYAGNSRRHLRRVVVALWYLALGVLLIDFTASASLFGLEALWGSPGVVPTMIHVATGLTIALLWTTYLLRSQQCRLRYPKSPGESVLRVFE